MLHNTDFYAIADFELVSAGESCSTTVLGRILVIADKSHFLIGSIIDFYSGGPSEG